MDADTLLSKVSDRSPAGIDIYWLFGQLDDESLLMTEITEQTSVARSTAERTINQFIEASLIIKKERECSLTPVGMVVFREITRTATVMGEDDAVHQGLEQISYLCGSEYRTGLLQAFVGIPRSTSEARKHWGVSKSTASRIVSELEERGWVVSDDGQYRSTQEGEAVLHSCARLRRYVAAVLERAPFFLRYGDRSVNLPLDGLENTHLAVSDAKSPQETLDALVELTSLNDVYRGDATLERIRAVCPIFSQSVFDIFEPLVDHGTEIEIIYDLESINELTEKGNSHYLSVNVVAPNVTFRVYPEELTIGFGTYDDAAMLAGYTEEYPYDAGLTTDDQSIVDWTNAEFDRFLAESESPKPYVADAIEAYLPGVDFSTSLDSDTQLSLPPMFGDQDPDDPGE